MNGGIEFCVYMTPCGYCSKFDKWCEKKCNNKRKTNFNFSNIIKENENGSFTFKDLEEKGIVIGD